MAAFKAVVLLFAALVATEVGADSFSQSGFHRPSRIGKPHPFNGARDLQIQNWLLVGCSRQTVLGQTSMQTARLTTVSPSKVACMYI